MDLEIVKTDHKYRRKLFTIYVIAIAIGAVVMFLGVPRILAVLKELQPYRLLLTVEISFIIILVSFIPASIFLIMIGKKILKFDAFPYPGMRVIRDTKIVRGKKARFRGKALIYFGLFAISLSIVSCIATHYHFWRLHDFLKNPGKYINAAKLDVNHVP